MRKRAAKTRSKAKPVEVAPVVSSLDKRLSMVALGDLKPHPRNYRVHLDDQLAHIVESLKEHGFYRNVVVARDGTILAGHGVVEAARRMEDRAETSDPDPGARGRVPRCFGKADHQEHGGD